VVFAACPLEGLDKLVLACVASHINSETLDCYPAVATLARECGLSERRVQYALRTAEEAGHLVIVTRGRGRHASVYRMGAELAALARTYRDGERRERNGIRMPSREPEVHGGAPLKADKAPEVHSGAPLTAVDIGPEVHGGAPQRCTAEHREVHGGAPQPEVNRNSTLPGETEMENRKKAAQLAKDLKAAGIDVDEKKWLRKLTEVIRLGGTLPDALRSIGDAQDGGKGDPVAYGLTALANSMRLRRGTASGSERPSPTWDDAPQSFVEQCARDLGIARWDPLKEQWPAYKARVSQARERSAA
jgi:hypothetical protein